MAKTRVLFTVEVVTDDDTGIYNIGEFEYGVPWETGEWLSARPERRPELAKWVRWLADRIEDGGAPFTDKSRPAAPEEKTTC